MRGDDGLALNSPCQSLFAGFFTRSFAGMTPNRWQLSVTLARMAFSRSLARPTAEGPRMPATEERAGNYLEPAALRLRFLAAG